MTDQELKHYGVPGMKWGQRKALQRLEKQKQLDKKSQENYDNKVKELNQKYKNNQKRLKRKLYELNATKDEYDMYSEWDKARYKAKMDKSYKNSDEYKSIKAKVTDAVLNDALYGPNTNKYYNAMVNHGGKTPQQAKRQKKIESIIASTALVTLGSIYAIYEYKK